jgi:hypothetical protein
MNALTLYHDLKARGVRLQADGELLKVDAPAGELAKEDRAALARVKPALLKLLCRLEEPQDDGRRFDARPSSYLGYTSLYDPTTGKWHDFPTRDCYPSIVELANTKRRKGGQHEKRASPTREARVAEDH